MQVSKRDGAVTQFDIGKIANACQRAAAAAGHAAPAALALAIAAAVERRCRERSAQGRISIAAIQRLVEDELMREYPEVARVYIQYRHDRDSVRARGSELHAKLMGLVHRTDEEAATENANKDANVFPVMRDLMAGIVSKQFAGNFLPKDILAAHNSGDIHFHDLDYSPFLPFTNCCLVDLKGMLEQGFRLGNAQIESPRSIGVACAVTAQIIAQVASHQYGGTTIPNIDQVLAPYVLKSYRKNLEVAREYGITEPERYARERAEKETYDGIQACEYEINTLFSSNGQQPFVTFSFGMGLGWEARIIQQSILRVRIKGLGKEGVTPVFPKLVMFIDQGVNLRPADPNYDIKQLALECASKRMYPDIISAELNRRITGSSVPVSPMGCRSFLPAWRDEAGREVLDGRNNLGVVSLNLPRIAIEARGDAQAFWALLEGRLGLCLRALMLRIERLRGVKANVAPILYTEGAFGARLKPDQDIMALFQGGRASISLGYIGLHEVGVLLFGAHPADSEPAQVFLRRVVARLSEAAAQWKRETGFGFSLYSTPSESLCNRFCKLDRERFGDIAEVTDKGYYTNSFHLDVFRKVNPFEKIDFETGYAELASGGHISYVELPNMKHNLQALERIWDYALERVPYFGSNTPVDSCGACGFMGEALAAADGFSCPQCGNRDSASLSVTRRVCGYLGSPNARPFNAGKQKEVMRRVKHFGGEH
ncbi:anaerobic ribonucleoside-triphosphate reductase [Chromobacterium subtsugae]|uniref:Anaerobic ribonucleoside-triphosphate reductase n=2 Tax=Chromobacterium subtsugae TaxID=251747 RepID=A0ABS7FCV5_9NEIS|nr:MULTISPECIES: anaerobic ribonucleoside-triphosphate reductase [Chromobacterium]KZE88230.1 anaerobic ribonucleoside triphosphate reductase [Chromobacterium sp. F49]MBW7565589.1 anaerobic ribonucleoside-triphosphate reductase [Chromobacterium subtsugae]MBW8287918.1 anaerobic ribonucleoside-triphosphate reductase [Chromobacterium subtsugae]WSE89685.1 anaerobic ribonucleoside-triphosphate reductase [Chromobacterium subtsugae]WVH58056.1 anaerobic ribonucleoside-triphosphate reductase [Chromobact